MSDITAAMESWLLEEEAKEAEKEAVEAEAKADEAEADEAKTEEEDKEESDKIDEEGAECGAAMHLLNVKEAEIRRMMTYVAKRGVDRAFVELCNHDDILNKAFKIPFAAAESYDVVGSPSSVISQEAFEGLKKGFDKVKAFASKAKQRIVVWFKMAWAWIRKMFFKVAAAVKKALGMDPASLEKKMRQAGKELYNLKVDNDRLAGKIGFFRSVLKKTYGVAARVVGSEKGFASIEEDYSVEDIDSMFAGQEALDIKKSLGNAANAISGKTKSFLTGLSKSIEENQKAVNDIANASEEDFAALVEMEKKYPNLFSKAGKDATSARQLTTSVKNGVVSLAKGISKIFGNIREAF